MAYSWPPTLAEAKAHLNITTTTNDGEIQAVLDAAVELIEDYVGAVATATVTDAFVTDTTTTWPYHYGTWPKYSYYAIRSVDLRTTPVQSVQSVVVSSMDGTNATTLSSSSYRVDTVNGSVTVIDGSPFGPLVTISYTAGRSSVPASLRLAALKLVKHLWADQRGSGSGRAVPGGGAGDEYMAPITPHLIPWEVEELLERYRPAATIA